MIENEVIECDGGAFGTFLGTFPFPVWLAYLLEQYDRRQCDFQNEALARSLARLKSTVAGIARDACFLESTLRCHRSEVTSAV